MKKLIFFLMFSVFSKNIFSLEKKEDKNKIFKQLPSLDEQLKTVGKKWKKVVVEAAQSYNFKILKPTNKTKEIQFIIENKIHLSKLENAIKYYNDLIISAKELLKESNKQSYQADIKPGIEALEEYVEALYDLKTIINLENFSLE